MTRSPSRVTVSKFSFVEKSLPGSTNSHFSGKHNKNEDFHAKNDNITAIQTQKLTQNDYITTETSVCNLDIRQFMRLFWFRKINIFLFFFSRENNYPLVATLRLRQIPQRSNKFPPETNKILRIIYHCFSPPKNILMEDFGSPKRLPGTFWPASYALTLSPLPQNVLNPPPRQKR